MFHSRRFRSIMRYLAMIISILVLGLLAWWGILYHQFGGLLARSSQFPKEYSVGPGSTAAMTYVVLGDSTAYGTGASRLQATYAYQTAVYLTHGTRRVHVINRSEVGAKLADVVKNQIPRLAGLHPDYVTVAVGANDATHFTPLPEFRQSLQQLLAGVHSWNHCTVEIATTPDMALVPALLLPFRQKFGRRALQQNDMLRDLSDGSHVRVVELYYQGKLDPAMNPNYYAGDRFHPADAGYKVWAKLFCRAFAEH